MILFSDKGGNIFVSNNLSNAFERIGNRLIDLQEVTRIYLPVILELLKFTKFAKVHGNTEVYVCR